MQDSCLMGLSIQCIYFSNKKFEYSYIIYYGEDFVLSQKSEV